MKKFVAMLLALLLVLVNVAALAADGPSTPNFRNTTNGATRGAGTASFTKVYVDETSSTTAASVFPKETLSFTVTAASGNPMDTTITVGTNNTYTVGSATSTITVNVPTPSATAFNKPGKYTYTVKEVAGNTEGMLSYDTTTEITVDVYVVYDTETTDPTDTKVLGTNVYTSIAADKTSKTDTIYNVYQVGNLTVGKTTSGNLADTSLPFVFEVEFTPDGKVWSDITISGSTAKAYSDAALTTAITTIAGDGWDTAKKIYVKAANGQSLKFENIPAGVTYTVKETQAETSTGTLQAVTKLTGNTEDIQLANANDPTAYYVQNEVTTATAVAAKGDVTVTVTNTKGVEIPMGISLETLPYVLILTVAAMGAVVLVLRKREEY